MKINVDLIKVRELLPHGSLTEISKKAGVHLNTVHLVLKGKSNNIKVLNAIADYLKNKENEELTVNGRLASFIQ